MHWAGKSGVWIARHDWADHPLGPYEHWPHALRLALASSFRSAAPKLVFWGDTHLAFPNDAFAALAPDFGMASPGEPFSSFLQETWQPLRDPLDRALRGAGGQSVEIPVPGKHDDIRPRFLLFLTPLFDQGDVPRGVLVDAEDRMQVWRGIEQALAKHRGLQLLMAEAPIIVAYGLGPDFHIEFANRAFRETFDVPGPNAAGAGGPLPDRFRQMIHHAYSTGEACAAEGVQLEMQGPKSGAARVRYADLHCQPIRDADSAATGVLCTGVDVTAKVSAQEEGDRLRHQVLHASRINAMGTMAMTLAHELSQPLAAAVNYAAATRKLMDSAEPETREHGRAMLGRSIQQINRVGEIIRRMRSMIRSGAADRRPVCVAEAADNAWRLLAEGTARVGFSKDVADDARMVLADAVQLEQILLNLFRNAVEASLETSRRQIELTTRRTGEGKVRVRVRDYGCGLPASWPEDFLSAGLPEDPSGLGVGLLLSRTLASANGGTLHASHADGGGTNFDIELEAPE